MADDDKREALNVFVSARIKRLVKDHARLMGVSQAAAAAFLIDEGARADRERRAQESAVLAGGNA